jgi:hypothetical protein
MESYEKQKDRGVLSMRAEYQRNMLNLYLQLSHFIEDESATQIDAGVRYNLDAK